MTFGPPSGAVSALDPLSYLNQNELRYVKKVIAQRAPTVRDKNGYAYGDIWIDQVTDTAYVFSNVTAGDAEWVAMAGGSASLVDLDADSGSASPSSQVITLAGTANQISTSASGDTVTFAVPSSFVAPGSVTATTTVTATLGAITATNGNLVLGTAGNKIVSSSVASTTTAGANSFGKVTLVAGTATVATTAVTASSIIYLTRQSPGATGAAALGQLSIGTITAGTSFVINALSNADSTALATTDVSSVAWFIVN